MSAIQDRHRFGGIGGKRIRERHADPAAISPCSAHRLHLLLLARSSASSASSASWRFISRWWRGCSGQSGNPGQDGDVRRLMVSCLLTYQFSSQRPDDCRLISHHRRAYPTVELWRIIALNELHRRGAGRQRQDATIRQCLRADRPSAWIRSCARERPGRYTEGMERDPQGSAAAAMKVVLAFPDVYEIGCPISAENPLRAFKCPPGRSGRARFRALAGFRTLAAGAGRAAEVPREQTSLEAFDVIGFSLLYELNGSKS